VVLRAAVFDRNADATPVQRPRAELRIARTRMPKAGTQKRERSE
jgi:hypothetical protein